jgi:hypothetical protein
MLDGFGTGLKVCVPLSGPLFSGLDCGTLHRCVLHAIPHTDAGLQCVKGGGGGGHLFLCTSECLTCRAIGSMIALPHRMLPTATKVGATSAARTRGSGQGGEG